jgi:hypothetical protein
MNIYKGENSIRAFLYQHKRESWGEHDVFVFFNKARNIMRGFAPANGALCYKKQPDKQTWDLTLRKDELLNSLGWMFGIRWNADDAVYEPVKEGAEDAKLRADVKGVPAKRRIRPDGKVRSGRRGLNA